MRILFVGVMDVPWSTDLQMMKELEKCGHNVTAFDYCSVMKNYAKAADSFIKKWQKFHKVLKRPFRTQHLQNIQNKSVGRYQMNRDLMNEVKCGNYDMVLMINAEAVDDKMIPSINEYSKTWYLYNDRLSEARRCDAIQKAKVSNFASATHSDVFEKFKEVNRSSVFLTQGINKELFRPFSVEKEIDVCFVGTATEERRALLDYIRSHGFRVIHYGPGTENDSIYLEDLATLYCRSKIVLNLNRSSVGFSDRVFQVLGTGTFLLSEYCQDLELFFKRKEEVDWFYSKEECVDLISYYLEDELSREIIAKTGLVCVFDNFSWEHVIKKMLHFFEKSQGHPEHISPLPFSNVEENISAVS